MKKFVKKILPRLPVSIQRYLTLCYEKWYSFKSWQAIKKEDVNTNLKLSTVNKKPRILFYHPSGLSFGGTEKFLQILAKHINKDDYEIFFMYSPKPRKATGLEIQLDGRKQYLEGQNIKLIPFDYSSMDPAYPYTIHNASPSIFDIINKENIDLIISTGSGYTEFPLNLIKKIPIIMLNIFGSFNVQKNFVYNCCISNAVANKIRPIVPENKISVMYIPSEGPGPDSPDAGLKLRKSLGIQKEDMVFGRIGRGSDDIYDEIGIRAFQKLGREVGNVHYIIMSPMPVIKKVVTDENIPNVHFLPTSAKEEDVWAFHQSIDCLAHFRKDGESCGLNIAESMLCAKPIITHRSHIWNAHLEYLDQSFSRVAEQGNIDQYYSFMKEFTDLKNNNKLIEFGERAKEKAEKIFLIKNSIKDFELLIKNALK
ncbi:MAG: glycosyltransferase [Patescibacteria group bacterium]